MKGVNKAIIIGTLGQDPDVRYTQNGKPVANVSVATNEKWGDEEKTEWHKIVMFGKLAEIAEKYLKKGSSAYFEGRIQTRKWQDQSGNDRYSTEIVANQMQMLGGRSAESDKPPSSSPPGTDPMAGDGFDDIPFS